MLVSCGQKENQHNEIKGIQSEVEKPIAKKKSDYLEEKRHSFIKEVVIKGNNKNYIIADYIDFLTGDKAVEKAKELGDAAYDVSKSGDTTYYIYKDYYLFNANPELRRVELAKEVNIELLDVKQNSNGIGYKEVSLLEFKEQIKRGQIIILRIENGIVVGMKEQFTP